MEQNIIGLRIMSNMGLPDLEIENIKELIENIENDIVELIEGKYKLISLGGSCEFIKDDDGKIKRIKE